MKNKHTAQGLVTPAGAEVLTDEQAEMVEGAIGFVAAALISAGLACGTIALIKGVVTYHDKKAIEKGEPTFGDLLRLLTETKEF